MQHIISSTASKHRLGAWLSLLGIILVALNLRAATVTLAPIYNYIEQSFAINDKAISMIGMLPALSFALFGLLAPRLTRLVGLEKSLIIAMIMTSIGELLRGYLSQSAWSLGLFSFISLGGMGLGNVLLPPAIKHYFPNHIGLLTSLYTVLTALSASIPSLAAVPTTATMGWRFAVGVWGILAFIALLPWLALIQKHHMTNHNINKSTYKASQWPTAWALAIMFSVGALSMYAYVAWLPKMLVSMVGISKTQAGIALALYNAVGIPHSIIIPMLLLKTKHPIYIIIFASSCLCIGSLGLGYFPQFSWGWIILIGLGAMFIPLGLTLINLRSNTEQGANLLSGFVQGVGYLIAAIGPFLMGHLYAWSGNWLYSCWFVAIAGILAGIAGAFSVRKVYIEDSNN